MKLFACIFFHGCCYHKDSLHLAYFIQYYIRSIFHVAYSFHFKSWLFPFYKNEYHWTHSSCLTIEILVILGEQIHVSEIDIHFHHFLIVHTHRA